VAFLGETLPTAPNVLTKLGHLIDPNGFPQVFAGVEPSVQSNTPLPDLGTLNSAILEDRASVVRVEGQACGQVIEGSGFVAGDGEIITNAHVVAGVTHPKIVDQTGTHQAATISFDPDLDLAILRANGVAGKPLTIHEQTVAPATAAAVLGYPGGGGFTASAAVILESFTATGRNIYNQGRSDRDIYSLKGDVQQGNSGGPVIAQDGSVIGVIFAKSITNSQVGYALNTSAVIQHVAQANGRTAPVGTGNCAE
jgi:S1-C subfamily serine protease